MAIRIRHPEAVSGRFFIFGDAASREAQLPQQTSGPRMVLFGCAAEILCCLGCILLTHMSLHRLQKILVELLSFDITHLLRQLPNHPLHPGKLIHLLPHLLG